MKLLNHTLAYFAALLFAVITGWAGLLYYNLLDEIYDSLDDGLENYKMLIIKRARADSEVLRKTSFVEDNYSIKPIPAPQALAYTDSYVDTLMFMENEQDFEPVRMLKTIFRQSGRYYELRVVNTMVETDDLVEDLLYSILWLYLGLIATVLVLNNLLLRKAWRPFYHLVRQLRSFRLEKQEPVSFGKTNVEEFKVLNDAVARLIRNSTDTYRSQKQFIENASHELQTPLAVSLNKLELLLEESSLTEGQLRLLAGAVRNLERMARLNKSLLLLSKIENRQFQAEEEVHLNSLVETVLEDFSDQASYRGLRVTLQEEGDCRLHLNPDLAGILLNNLVKNAIVHNNRGGFVRVTVGPQQLVVENSGQPAALNEQLMFSRFQSGSQNETSTGLGLPIVKAIADLYRFRIAYRFQGTHIVTIHFSYPFS